MTMDESASDNPVAYQYMAERTIDRHRICSGMPLSAALARIRRM
ncbi:MAG: hypothetical protein VX970_12170 [Planctomycetota bacterium]|nr:hypothetical protein [Planctomycetota bacterium]